MERGLIFDCDGVLADTELHGHLAAFNRMWKNLGIPWQWSDEQYAEKLKIGGGKERMASLFLEREFQQVFPVPKSEEDRKALIASWHKEKTAISKSSHQARFLRVQGSKGSRNPLLSQAGSWRWHQPLLDRRWRPC